MLITKKHIEEFKCHLIEEEKSTATFEKYIRDITAFFVWLAGRELDKITVLRYKEHLINSSYAPTSINSVLSSLNSFFEHNGWQGLKVRMLKIQKQIFAERCRELTKSEYERLLLAAKQEKNDRLYYLMQTICSSGIRVSELSAITVEALKSRKADINCKGKIRVVILPKDLCRMLVQYAKSKKIASGSVFVTKTGKPLDRSTIWKMMKALCIVAGVDKEKVFFS